MSQVMQRRAIPSSGIMLPVVGCGTWRAFDVGGDRQRRARLAEVLDILFEAGGSLIDSSPMYGTAEQVVGDLLAERNQHPKAFLATKVWTSGARAGLAQMQRSFDLLRSARIDLMQVHNLLDWQSHLAGMQRWKEEGRIGHIGLTHYTASAHEQLEAAMRAGPIDFVQLNYALDDRAAERRLLPLARERGIAVLVNRPFGSGPLIRRLAAAPLPGWADEIDCRSWAEILLKFLLANPAVTCVIPATAQPVHMRENVRAGFGPLPDSDLLKRIAAFA